MKVVGGKADRPTIVLLAGGKQVVFFNEVPVVLRTVNGEWFRRYDHEYTSHERVWVKWYLRSVEEMMVHLRPLEELQELADKI